MQVFKVADHKTGQELLSLEHCLQSNQSSSAFPGSISGVHLFLLLRFPAISLGFTILLCSPATFLGFTFFVSQLYLWGSPSLFLSSISGLTFCILNCISGVHQSSSSAFPAYHSYSSSVFPSSIFGVHLLPLHSQLYLWSSPSSSPAFPI